jgi:radical SAM protein with 4Fe4S-binding SPASM domain
MCPLAQNKNMKAMVMPDELFEKIIIEISQNHLRSTYVYLFLQNEPLMDKDIFKKLKLIKKISSGKIKTGLVTNGTLLPDKKIKELNESKIDEIIFSLDALTEETYNKIRPGLSFKNVMKNIENVIDSSYDKYLAVKFVLQKDNISEFDDFKKYWKKKGIPIQISPLNNRSGDLRIYDDLRLKKRDSSFLVDLKQYIGNFMMGRIITRGCSLPLTTFNILYNGVVILCCDDFSNKMVLGNVNTSSIKEIWNSKKYQKIREMLYDGEHKKISVCQTCSKISS